MTAPSSSTTSATAPRATGSRIVGIDLARGIALLGMASTHVLEISDRDTGYLTPVGLVFAGRSSALFALLAGVSLALVTGAATPVRGRERSRASVSIAVRAVLIALIGLVLVDLGAPVAVILTYYAVLFVLSLPFLGLRTGTLAALAISWAVVAPVVSHLLRPYVEPGPGAQVGLEVLATEPLDALTRLLLTGYYPVLTWLAYLLAGLAIGRSDLRDRATGVRLLLGGVALAVVAWGTSTLLLATGAAEALEPDQVAGSGPWAAAWWLQNQEEYGTTPVDDWRHLLVAGAHTGTPFDLLHTMGTAAAVLGACLLLTRADVVRRILRPVSAIGSMTLTLYTVHVVVLVMELGTWGEPAYYWTQVVVALIAAPLWLMRFRRGPLEQLVHAISHDIARAAVPDPRTPPRPPNRSA